RDDPGESERVTTGHQPHGAPRGNLVGQDGYEVVAVHHQEPREEPDAAVRGHESQLREDVRATHHGSRWHDMTLEDVELGDLEERLDIPDERVLGEILPPPYPRVGREVLRCRVQTHEVVG